MSRTVLNVNQWKKIENATECMVIGILLIYLIQFSENSLGPALSFVSNLADISDKNIFMIKPR